ncbi:hypothetical protein C7271_22615 [filamentous cyanobacterium CCP5]|nr:hypothetical protein C7271_22615 [filamentous cyanobacterium CCP5]
MTDISQQEKILGVRQLWNQSGSVSKRLWSTSQEKRVTSGFFYSKPFTSAAGKNCRLSPENHT